MKILSFFSNLGLWIDRLKKISEILGYLLEVYEMVKSELSFIWNGEKKDNSKDVGGLEKKVVYKSEQDEKNVKNNIDTVGTVGTVVDNKNKNDVK